MAGEGRLEEVRQALDRSPELVNASGPHPFWGGRPQPLHIAIETRQYALFELLLEAGADVDGAGADYDLWSPLMLASAHPGMRDELLRRGSRVGVPEALLLADDSALEDLLAGGVAALPDRVPGGGSLLNFARTIRAIDRLVALGVSTTMPDRWGATPLTALSRLGARGAPLVSHLVALGVPAGAEHFARLGDRAALEALPEAEVATDTVMIEAVESGSHSLVQWLLERGAPVQARAPGSARQTALHCAAWRGDLKMAEILVRAGASLTARDDEHNGTPEEWADAAAVITKNEACRSVSRFLAACAGGAG